MSLDETMEALLALNSLLGNDDEYGPIIEIYPDGSYNVMLPNSAIIDGYSSVDRANGGANQHIRDAAKAIKQWFDYHEIECPKVDNI